MPRKKVVKKRVKKQTKVGKIKGIEKVLAFISYIWLLFLIPLLFRRDSKFAMYHAKQGLVLFVYTIIVNLLAYVTVLGFILSLFWLVLFLVGIINAITGRMNPIPLIGVLGERLRL